MSENVKRTERGWAGHYICAASCLFRRNTLLEKGNVRIVVSTVGLHKLNDEFISVGFKRYFETMAFHAEPAPSRFSDADVSRRVLFSSPWSIGEVDADDKANDMHEAVVAEIAARIEAGEFDNQ